MNLRFSAAIRQIGYAPAFRRNTRRAVAKRALRDGPLLFSVDTCRPEVAVEDVVHLVAPREDVDDGFSIRSYLRSGHGSPVPGARRIEVLFRIPRNGGKQQRG